MNVLHVGQFVKTSKGKVGFVKEAPYYSIGYHTDGNWKELTKFSQEFSELELEDYVTGARHLSGNPLTTYSLVNATVRLGKKDFAISADKLLPLEYVTFTVGSENNGSFTLPGDAAIRVLNIFEDNNVWYHLS
jgi:hypothetical protein